ncbi:hypothetical protein KKF45_04765 [Patescibacteria group bacterium]|nr:hypothetical protein [Patescibacteria group bacterium]
MGDAMAAIVEQRPRIPAEVGEEQFRRVIREEFGFREFYLTLVGNVVAGTPVRVDVRNALGYETRRGFISSLDGTISVRFNMLDWFEIEMGETLDLEGLLVWRIDITTTSATPLGFKGLVI